MSTYSNIFVHYAQRHEVLLGWDPALNRFFLVVENLGDDMNQAEPVLVYSNLDDKALTPELYQDLNYFKKKLQDLGLFKHVEEKTWAAMQVDQDEAKKRQ